MSLEYTPEFLKINVDQLGEETAEQPQKLAQVARARAISLGRKMLTEYNYSVAKARFKKNLKDGKKAGGIKMTDVEITESVYLDSELDKLKREEIQAAVDHDHMVGFFEACKSRGWALPNLRQIEERIGGLEK